MENQEEPKKKKSKKGIIIAVVVIVILIAIAGSGGDGTEKDTKQATKTESTNKKEDSKSDSKKEESKKDDSKSEDSNKEGSKETKKPEKKKVKTYKTGTYKVGSDMPEGEYIIEADSIQGYFEITKDSSGDMNSIVANDNFTTHTYVSVKKGQYIKIIGTAKKSSDVAAIKPKDGKYGDGMYKVGKDIAPGEYKIYFNKDSVSGMGYIEVSKDSYHGLDSIVSNDTLQGDKYQTLKKGQYVKLQDAYIKK